MCIVRFRIHIESDYNYTHTNLFTYQRMTNNASAARYYASM